MFNCMLNVYLWFLLVKVHIVLLNIFIFISIIIVNNYLLCEADVMLLFVRESGRHFLNDNAGITSVNV